MMIGWLSGRHELLMVSLEMLVGFPKYPSFLRVPSLPSLFRHLFRHKNVRTSTTSVTPFTKITNKVIAITGHNHCPIYMCEKFLACLCDGVTEPAENIPSKPVT